MLGNNIDYVMIGLVNSIGDGSAFDIVTNLESKGPISSAKPEYLSDNDIPDHLLHGVTID
jgi:hypothetical protein